MKIHQAQLALRYPAKLGEGPVWDQRRQALFWIDSTGNKVCIFYPASGRNQIYELDQNIGTLVLTENEDIVIVGLEDGLYQLDLRSGIVTLKRSLEREQTGNRLNDGKADAAGRIWIGSMTCSDNGAASERKRTEVEYPCALYCVEPDFSYSTQIPRVRLSNGMAWTEDNRTFYYIDTLERAVFAFDFDVSGGKIANGRICISVPPEMGLPDGMDIDRDGNLWIAHWGGWCVGKWNPRTGELLEKVEVPVCRVASCGFGGRNFEDLYIVTCSEVLPADGKPQPDAGCIFVANNLGVRGIPFHYFGGYGAPL